MSDINVNALTYTEMKEQARILGLDVKGNISAEELRKQLRLAVGEETETPKLAAKPKANWKTVYIAEDDKDSQPAFVGVNGKSYRIRRGEEVEVPPEVVEALKNAVQRTWDTKAQAWRMVPTYPWSLRG